MIPEDPDAAGALREDIRPDRAERRLRLISAVAQGRRWLDEIVSGSITDAEQLAKRERCTERQINLTLSLAFLAPRLVNAAVEGRRGSLGGGRKKLVVHFTRGGVAWSPEFPTRGRWPGVFVSAVFSAIYGSGITNKGNNLAPKQRLWSHGPRSAVVGEHGPTRFASQAL